MLHFFAVVLHLNCTALSQSEPSNFSRMLLKDKSILFEEWVLVEVTVYLLNQRNIQHLLGFVSLLLSCAELVLYQFC